MSHLADLRLGPLFHNLSEDAVRKVARVVIQRRFSAGDVVLAQQARGEALHLITSGAVRVSRAGAGA